MEVIAAAETWLDGQPPEFFLSGLQKSEFGSCSLFPSWSAKDSSAPWYYNFLTQTVRIHSRYFTFLTHL